MPVERQRLGDAALRHDGETHRVRERERLVVETFEPPPPRPALRRGPAGWAPARRAPPPPRTTSIAASRPTLRSSSACVSATTRFVVTTRAPARTLSRSARATAAWSGWDRTTAGYQPLVSTNSSAATWLAESWPP